MFRLKKRGGGLQGKSDDPGVFPVLVAGNNKIPFRTICLNTISEELPDISKSIRILTDDTLHKLKLLGQFSSKLLLAVVEFYILWGCLPQPSNKVRINKLKTFERCTLASRMLPQRQIFSP